MGWMTIYSLIFDLIKKSMHGSLQKQTTRFVRVRRSTTKLRAHEKAPESVKNQGLAHLVAWGGIEKPPATCTTTRFTNSSYLLGYALGYTKTGLRRPELMASHHGHLAAEAHYPTFAAARQPAPVSREQRAVLTGDERDMSWQTGLAARSQPTPMGAIASAIRLLADNGYVVLKAPTWPEHLPVKAMRPPPIPVRAPTLASGSPPKDVLSGVRDFMSVKQFCSLLSIGRSTAYAYMKFGRLKVQKIGWSTRISRQSVREWLAAEKTAD
jgi:excisionase family DNA binding protein